MGYDTLRKSLLAAGLLLAMPVMAGGMATPSMLSNTCAGCHGEDGRSRGPATPSIGGLSKNYIIGAMLAYKHGDDVDAMEAAIAANSDVLDPDMFEALPRTGTIMSRIAKGYSDKEIIAIAGHFSALKFKGNAQAGDAALVARGAKVHDKRCEKCHEEGGSFSEDDVGLLAGQWKPYLSYTLADLRAGDRKMPKKMAAKMKKLQDGDREALVEYYGSQGN